MVRYWLRVFGRAFRDAGGSLEHNPKKAMFGTITLLISLGVITWAKSGAEASSHFETWIFNLLAVVVVFVVVFFFFILKTPEVLEKESVASAKGKADELESQLARVREELGRLSEVQREQATAHAKQQEEWKREIERQRNSNPQRNALRHQVEKFIAQFEALGEKIARGDKEAGVEVYRLENETKLYFMAHLPQYTRFVGDHPIGNEFPSAQHLNIRDARTRCQYRIDRLKNEILGMIG
jgi:hypothetical protein